MNITCLNCARSYLDPTTEPEILFCAKHNKAALRIAELHRQLGRAIRTIRYIRACIPAETFRPKNEHTHTTILQRIHNELTRYETAK